MIEIVLLFLFLGIYFYLLFGGADFGVGILELFSGKKNKAITKSAAYRVIGPVWEANHVWLILVLVLLWVCFPSFYHQITVQLHIPLTLLLIGIIARGTAFVFRHYDAYQDNSQKVYDRFFEWGSVFSVFMIGINAGAVLSGNMIHPSMVENSNFTELYIFSWLNPFSLLSGVFLLALTSFTSAIFIINESNDSEYNYYRKKALRSNILLLVSGLLVWIIDWINDGFLSRHLFDHSISIAGIFITSLLFIPLWKFINQRKRFLPQAIVGVQILGILLAWASQAFPYIMATKTGDISILENLPPDSVFFSTTIALIVAALIVLPGIYHLFKSFGLIRKRNQ